MQMLLIQAMVFLAQSDSGPEIPWWLAVALGPVGLTAFLLYYSHTLRKEMKAKDAEIKHLNEERRKDLVSGMLYRENQSDKLLEHDQASRENLNKLVEALTELGRVMEKTNGTTQEVAGAVQAVKVQLATIQGQLGNHGGGTSTDVRGTGDGR